MKTIVIPAAFLFLISPATAREKTYKEVGYCDMIAVRDTRAIQGTDRPIKKGEKLIMVGKEIADNGELLVSEYRCCEYRLKDFRYAGKRCRLPAAHKF